MRPFARILLCSACMLSLAVAPSALADDEDAPSDREPAKAKRGKEDIKAKGSIAKEMAALGEAAAMLAEVKDAATAEKVAEKLSRKFAHMPPVLNGGEGELEMLAKAQNRVSDQMQRLMASEYFVPSGLQEAWTLMTDPFSRRSAQKRRRK